MLAAASWLSRALRPVAVPAAAVALAWAAGANVRAPGTAWAACRRAGGRATHAVWRVAPLVIAVGSFVVGAGVLTASALVRGALLFTLQAALFPDTPLVLFLLTLLGATLLLDARGVRISDAAQALLRRVPRSSAGYLADLARCAAVAGGGMLLAAALVPPTMQGWGRAEAPDAQRYNFYSSFFNFAISADRIESREGFDLGKLGLTLRPGASGSIVFRLERTPESLVLLRANFFHRVFDERAAILSDVVYRNALEVSTDGGLTFERVLEDTTVGEVLGSSSLDLTPFLGGSRTYRLRFSAVNTTPLEVVVLPSLVVSVVTDPLAFPHAAFPVVPYAGAAAVFCYLLVVARGIGRGWAALAALTGAASVALASLAAGLVTSGFPPGSAVAAQLAESAEAAFARGALAVARAGMWSAAGVLACVWWMRRRDRVPLHAPLAVACLAVGALALDVRWTHLIRARYEFVLPDAQGYRHIASEIPGKIASYFPSTPRPLLTELFEAGFDGRTSPLVVFYAGGNNGREPLWPWTLRFVFDLLGESAFQTRLSSLLFGAVVCALTCWIGWRLLHPLVGLVGGVLLAYSTPHAANSIAGLREEFVTTLLVLLIGVLFAGARRGAPLDWWRWSGAGLLGAGIVLVRADMLPMSAVLVTAAALAMRWPWRKWLAAGVLIGVLAGPMYVGYWFTHGDAFYPGTYGATVNRNLEFPERMGTPGFPSAEEYAGSWAAGPRISPMTYFFSYHTVPQFLEYMVRGLVRIFPTVLFDFEPLLLRAFLVGLGVLIVMRKWHVPFLLLATLLPFYAFMAGVPNPWVFPGRYAHHAYPYAELAAAAGLCAVPLAALSLWRRQRGRGIEAQTDWRESASTEVGTSRPPQPTGAT